MSFFIVLFILFIIITRLIVYLCKKYSGPNIKPGKRRFFKLNELEFKQPFLFGACSAPWQVEKAVKPSNWTLFEKQNKSDGTPCAPPHLNGCEAIEKFDIDLENLKALNLKAYRFGISWSAIHISKNKFDFDYLQHYIDQIHKLKAAGIEPVVTLWHFEIPAWIQEEGGLLSPNFVTYFKEFLEFCVPHLIEEVNIWITVNEPAVYSLFGYVTGEFPPGKHFQLHNFFIGLSNLLKAHAEAYHYLHHLKADVKVSLSKHILPFVPVHKWSAIENAICAFANQFNSSIFEAIETGVFSVNFCYIPLYKETISKVKDTLDFIAINHYVVDFVSISPFDWESISKPLITGLPKYYDKSDFGWDLVPDSLAKSVEWINDIWNPRKLKIIITEHGLSDQKDTKRERHVVDSLGNLSEIIKNGVPVEGYLYWSFIDNYEWAAGYSQRFGLISIDFQTQERVIRNSAKTISKIAKQSQDN